MPRDSSGLYSLPPSNPVVDGTVIETSWANPTMTDLALQLNNAITRDGLLGPTGPIGFADGTAASPGIAFGAQPNTGFFRPGSNVIGFSIGGVQVFSVTATGMTFPLADGTAAAPSLAFTADPTTGLYRSTSAGSKLGLSVGGVGVATFTSTAALTLSAGGSMASSGTTSGSWSIGPQAASTGSMELRATAAAAIAPTIDMNVIASDGATAASVRLFRTTNTTGTRAFMIFRGDNTATIDHQLNAGTAGVTTSLSRGGGRTLIGTATDDGSSTLQIAGTTHIGGIPAGAGYGTLGVRTSGPYGGTGGSTGYRDIVVESTANCGISLLTASTQQAAIAFGDEVLAASGRMIYDHTTDQFTFACNGSTRLTISPTALISASSSQIQGGAGTAAAPGYAFNGRLDEGLWSPGSNQLELAITGAGMLRLQNVAGDARILGGGLAAALQSAAGRGLLEVNGSSGSLFGLDVAGAAIGYLAASASSMELRTVAAAPLLFSTIGVERARINATAAGTSELTIGIKTALLSAANRGLLEVNGADAVIGLDVAGVSTGYLYATASDVTLSTVTNVPLKFGVAAGIKAQIDTNGVFSVGGIEVGFRGVPRNVQGAGYTAVYADRGKMIYVTAAGTTTIPVGVFNDGDVVTIGNGTGVSITIGQGAGTTLYLCGSTVAGNRTLAVHGIAAVTCLGGNAFFVSGNVS